LDCSARSLSLSHCWLVAAADPTGRATSPLERSHSPGRQRPICCAEPGVRAREPRVVTSFSAARTAPSTTAATRREPFGASTAAGRPCASGQLSSARTPCPSIGSRLTARTSRSRSPLFRRIALGVSYAGSLSGATSAARAADRNSPRGVLVRFLVRFRRRLLALRGGTATRRIAQPCGSAARVIP